MCISGVKCGILRYFGKTHFAEGEWCGIELEEPDGKHDGVVENVRYFTCQQGYGIFAPISKVEPAEYPTGVSSKVADENGNGNGNQSVVSQLKQPKFKSKLAKPKAIVKPLSQESQVDSVNDSVSGSPSSTGGTPKLSKLPTGIAKPSKLPLQLDHKQDKTKAKQSKLKPKSKKSESGKNVTFSLDEENIDTRDEHFDYDIPEVTTPSRVDAVSALTLAYDLESSGSDNENRTNKQGLNETFTKEGFDEEKNELSNRILDKTEKSSEASFQNQEGTLTSPIPDLLTPSAFHGIPEPSDDAGEAMSESEAEDDLEFLGQSTASQASSLGVLGDSQLASNSLLNSDIKRKLGRQQSKESVEISEKDLDNEIAGVVTPEVQSEIEMSSSTISCDSVQHPNLEPDIIRKEHDLTFDPLPGNTSTPSSPAKAIHTKKMANQDGNVELTQQKEPVMNMTFALTTGATGDATFTVKDTEGEDSETHGRSKGQANEYPEDILRTDEDEVDGTSMAASIELAKTAVSQYADLVQSAEIERVNKETRDAEKAAKKARLEELRSKRRSVEMDVDIPSEDQTENVLVELRKGYTGLQRPLSTCSTDTGICMDSSVTSIDSDGRRERPLSMVSSVSTDAGKPLREYCTWYCQQCLFLYF